MHESSIRISIGRMLSNPPITYWPYNFNSDFESISGSILNLDHMLETLINDGITIRDGGETIIVDIPGAPNQRFEIESVEMLVEKLEMFRCFLE